MDEYYDDEEIQLIQLEINKLLIRLSMLQYAREIEEIKIKYEDIKGNK